MADGEILPGVRDCPAERKRILLPCARSQEQCGGSKRATTLGACAKSRALAMRARSSPNETKMNPKVKIAPSILSANFALLGAQITEAVEGGADYIHVDVMDGHFVPNITIGPLIVEAIRPITSLPLDVHLMIENPDRYLADFARAGADIITVQLEACPHLHRVVQAIKELKVKAGVAINPATPVSSLTDILSDLDLVLIMTVNPGFGGQKFIPNSLRKLRALQRMIAEQGAICEVEVDGGINPQTAAAVVTAGAEILVAGSAVFNQTAAVSTNIAALRESYLGAAQPNE